METYDIKKHIEFEKANTPMTSLNAFGGSVADEVAKVKVSYDFETRPHVFDDGEPGQVANKLTITIDFADATIQPHQDFEDGFCHAVTEVLADEINGLFENAE